MIVQFPLDDHIVCLNTETQALSVANQVGARILELYSSGLPHEDICATLSDEFQASDAQIDNDVRSFVTQMESGTVPEHRPAQIHQPDTDFLAERPPQNITELKVYLPSGTVNVRSESADVIEAIQPLFQLSGQIVQRSQLLQLDIYEDGDCYPIVFNQQTLDIGISVEDAAIACLRVMNVLVSQIESHAFTLHAGAVALNDSGVLLAARGGSGKSTLTAYLMSQGYKLINDDSVQLSAAPVKLVPVPVPLSVKEGSWNILANWFPRILQQRAYGLDGYQQRYLPPLDDQVCLKPVPCALVCFPRYREGANTQVIPMERALALSMLIESGCYLPKPIESAHLQQLVDWAQGLDFYSLEYSSLAEAEAVLRKLIYR